MFSYKIKDTDIYIDRNINGYEINHHYPFTCSNIPTNGDYSKVEIFPTAVKAYKAYKQFIEPYYGTLIL